MNGGAIPIGTQVTQTITKATQRDVKQILDSHKEFVVPTSSSNSKFRPKLLKKSTSDTADGDPKKKNTAVAKNIKQYFQREQKKGTE